MSIFDQLVDQALQNEMNLSPLRIAVEKELLHHDILREISSAGLLANLTFIGGTCLRLCYGSNRLSEDLDFTAGRDFKREDLAGIGPCIVKGIQSKYFLTVEVSEPVKETGNVDTWKIKIITRPERKDLPSQKINIDISAIPSYERKPVILRNRYQVDMGTSGLILQAQSREEIFADKMVALALRPNRVKWRDIWDITWLKQNNVILPLTLIPGKVADHQRDLKEFIDLLYERCDDLIHNPASHDNFINEMQRFLPPEYIEQTIKDQEFWGYLTELVAAEVKTTQEFVNNPLSQSKFKL